MNLAAIITWSLVFLFWLVVFGKRVLLKDEARAKRYNEWSERTLDRIASGVFKFWYRVNPRFRHRWDAAQKANPDELALWLLGHGIRAKVFYDDNGQLQMLIHQDDKQKVVDLFGEFGIAGATPESLFVPR